MEELSILPPPPTTSSAKVDLYKVISVTLAVIIILGILATVITLFIYQSFFRISLTITLLAAFFHIIQAVKNSHIPRS